MPVARIDLIADQGFDACALRMPLNHRVRVFAASSGAASRRNGLHDSVSMDFYSIPRELWLDPTTGRSTCWLVWHQDWPVANRDGGKAGWLLTATERG